MDVTYTSSGDHQVPQQTSDEDLIRTTDDASVRDVWSVNLEREFDSIRQVIQKYSYVAMDTEFPGVVAKPIGEFRSAGDYQYHMLRTNVGLLKIIQVGMTFYNENGESPEPYTTWQFNFKFKLNEDMYAQDSIDLLKKSGIDFRAHEENGIEPCEFAELLMTSGVILNDNATWISFHSGYDFGYMLKMCSGCSLPESESDFFEILRIYFPRIFDVKYLMKSCRTLKGGLQEVAEQLEVQRVGPQHQAGSDSKLTGAAFFKMRQMFFDENIDDTKYCGHLYGLGMNYSSTNGMSVDTAYAGPVNPNLTAVPMNTDDAVAPISAN